MTKTCPKCGAAMRQHHEHTHAGHAGHFATSHGRHFPVLAILGLAVSAAKAVSNATGWFATYKCGACGATV